MQKRACIRLPIPGVVLYYKDKPGFWGTTEYPDRYYPVMDISKGGTRFLCDERFEAGKQLMVKLSIPEEKTEPQLIAIVRWISKNREQSYKYQTGLAFISYGDRKNENSTEVLRFLEKLEEMDEWK